MAHIMVDQGGYIMVKEFPLGPLEINIDVLSSYRLACNLKGDKPEGLRHKILTFFISLDNKV